MLLILRFQKDFMWEPSENMAFSPLVDENAILDRYFWPTITGEGIIKWAGDGMRCSITPSAEMLRTIDTINAGRYMRWIYFQNAFWIVESWQDAVFGNAYNQTPRGTALDTRTTLNLRLDTIMTFLRYVLYHPNKPVLVKRSHQDRYNADRTPKKELAYTKASDIIGESGYAYEPSTANNLSFVNPPANAIYNQGALPFADIVVMNPNTEMRKHYAYSADMEQPPAIIIPLISPKREPFIWHHGGTHYTKNQLLSDVNNYPPVPAIIAPTTAEINNARANWDAEWNNYIASNPNASSAVDMTSAQERNLTDIITDRIDSGQPMKFYQHYTASNGRPMTLYTYSRVRRYRTSSFSNYYTQQETEYWLFWGKQVQGDNNAYANNWNYFPTLQKDADDNFSPQYWQSLMVSRLFLPLGYLEPIANNGTTGEVGQTNAPSYKTANPSATFTGNIIVRNSLERQLGGFTSYDIPNADPTTMLAPGAGEWMHLLANETELWYGGERLAQVDEADILNANETFACTYYLSESQVGFRMKIIPNSQLNRTLSGTMAVSQPITKDQFTNRVNATANTYALNYKLQTEQAIFGGLGIGLNLLKGLFSIGGEKSVGLGGGANLGLQSAQGIKGLIDPFRRLDAETADSRKQTQNVGAVSLNVAQHIENWMKAVNTDNMFSNFTLQRRALEQKSKDYLVYKMYRTGYPNNQLLSLDNNGQFNFTWQTRQKFDFWQIENFEQATDGFYLSNLVSDKLPIPSNIIADMGERFRQGITLLHTLLHLDFIFFEENWEISINP